MGTAYKITYPPTVAEGERYGETDHIKRLINIEAGLDHDMKREVVIHEMLHQVLYMAGVELPEDTEETVATILGRSLLGHIRDNTTLWRWLLQKPPKDQPSADPVPA
jgi:hypothetical protein